MRKKLLIIPIAHSEAEMGSLSDDLAKMLDAVMGKTNRDRHRDEVYTFWQNLSSLLESVLKTEDVETVQIFQDGMPADGELGLQLVEDCAQNGSPNFRLVLSLLRRGARLEATEDPQLLKEEYEILKDILSAETASEMKARAGKRKQRLFELTEERDRYIAGRIQETLGENMLGILFIGATHDITPYLSPEIDYFVCTFVEKDIVNWWWRK